MRKATPVKKVVKPVAIAPTFDLRTKEEAARSRAIEITEALLLRLRSNKEVPEDWQEELTEVLEVANYGAKPIRSSFP